jgi:Flp pilus assembly protein TadB
VTVLAALAAALAVLLLAPAARRPFGAAPRSTEARRRVVWAGRRRRASGSQTRRHAADVALAADLVVAALAAGVPLSSAVDAVGRALGGEIGSMLGEVHRLQQVGADAVTATTRLREAAGTARLGRALARAGSSGSSPVQVLAAAADAERSRLRTARVARARGAGSLAALPMGLLFLPAFVLVAVVPIVVGSLSSVLG